MSFVKKLLFSAVFTLCLLEIGFRITSPRKLFNNYPKLRMSDAYGWDSIPTIDVMNNSGHGIPVYFDGDSFTQGTSWAPTTQEILKQHGILIDGYNIGVSGYGTFQEYLKLSKTIDEHHPKIVVVLFYAWNDLRDNLSHPSLYYNIDTLYRPYWDQGNKAIRWFERLEIYEHIYLRAEYFVVKRLARRYGMDIFVRSSWPTSIPYGAPGAWEPFYNHRTDSSLFRDAAWEQTTKSFQEMKNLTDKYGARLIVIGIDNPFSVDQDVYDAYVRPLNDPDFDVEEPLRRLSVILKDNHIEFINGIPLLRALSKQTHQKVYNGPPGDLSGHLTEGGYHVIAEAAAAAISRTH